MLRCTERVNRLRVVGAPFQSKQQEKPIMRMKVAAIAVAGIVLVPLSAFAQSAPAPVNQTGPGITAPVSGPTDMGIAGVSGNTRAAPGGMYTTAPQATVIAPGYGSYAAVPSPGYRGRAAIDGYNVGRPAFESDED
jgi:hypothetical protein